MTGKRSAGVSRVAAFLSMCAVTMLACSGDDSSSGGGGLGGNGGLADASALDTAMESSSGAGGSGMQDPRCSAATRNGFFADCSLCGADCDTIDDGTGTYEACGCSGGCPCGLRCGSYPIAPGVVVSDICVR